MISMHIKQPSSLLSHSLSCVSYRVSNTSCCDFMGKCNALLVNMSRSIAVTAVLSPRLMVLPSARQRILEVCFSRALVLISTPSFVTPRDFPPIIFISAVYQNEMKSLSTLFATCRAYDFSRVKNPMSYKTKSWESRHLGKTARCILHCCKKPHSS